MKTTELNPAPPAARTAGSQQQVVKQPPYRVSNWINTKTMLPVWGIQRRREDGRWVNCACDNTPLLYDNEQTAKKHCKWLNDPKGTEPEWNTDLAA